MSTFLGWIVAAIFIAWLLAAIYVLGCAICEWRLRRDARRASRSYWDMRDALREEDVRLKAEEPMMSNWKPIETAPKDGTEVLLYWPLEGLGDLHSKIKIGSWHSDAWGWQDRFCRSYTDAPTHWQPLPDPPKPRKPRDLVDAEPSRRLIKPKRDDTTPLPEYLLRKDRF